MSRAWLAGLSLSSALLTSVLVAGCGGCGPARDLPTFEVALGPFVHRINAEGTLSGELVWGRLWGESSGPIRTTPICLLPREDLDRWEGLTAPPELTRLSGPARDIHEALAARGALFPQELAVRAKLVPAHLEMGLAELISYGALTCDSFGALRQLIVPPSKRRPSTRPAASLRAGRWSLFRREAAPAPSVEFVARQLLRRTGVVFRRTIEREKIPVPWRDLVRALRGMELRGEVRGGRFVAGFSGEQFALPEAIPLLRAVRKRGETEPVAVAAADPLNYRGILTPDARVSPAARRTVPVG